MIIKGYASLFDTRDHDNDTLIKGAFKSSLLWWKGSKKWPYMLWQHELKQPIGRWLDMHEDPWGLYVTGELNINTQRGAEAKALLEQGAIDSLSIGFRTLKSRRNPRTHVREILDVDLIEVSLVTLPANPRARVEPGSL